MAEEPLLEPAEAGSFVLVELDGRIALYDRRSNRTHLLDPLSAEIVCVIAEDPSLETSSRALCARLMVASAGASSEIDKAAVQIALDQLRRAGLVS